MGGRRGEGRLRSTGTSTAYVAAVPTHGYHSLTSISALIGKRNLRGWEGGVVVALCGVRA